MCHLPGPNSDPNLTLTPCPGGVYEEARGHTGVVLDEQLLTTTQRWTATQGRVRIMCWQGFEGSMHLSIAHSPLARTSRGETRRRACANGDGETSVGLSQNRPGTRGEGTLAPPCREYAAMIKPPPFHVPHRQHPCSFLEHQVKQEAAHEDVDGNGE